MPAAGPGGLGLEWAVPGGGSLPLRGGGCPGIEGEGTRADVFPESIHSPGSARSGPTGDPSLNGVKASAGLR